MDPVRKLPRVEAPTKLERREHRKRELRGQILDAAALRLTEHGLHATKLAEIYDPNRGDRVTDPVAG